MMAAPRKLTERQRRSLTEAGVLHPDLIGRNAKRRRCGECGSAELAGLVSGLAFHCDPAPLSAAGELAVLLNGGLTLRLYMSLWEFELHPRYHFDIRGHPAGDPANEFDVLAMHRCEWAVPPALSAPSVLRVRGIIQSDDRPPF